MSGYNIISDIAGNYETLLRLLDQMPKDATVVSIGDMIDRGPKSKEVLDFFMKDGNKALMGNHDHFLISSYYSDQYYDYGVWMWNGGGKTLQSFGVRDVRDIDKKYPEFIKSLPLYLKFKERNKDGLKGFISHAAKRPDFSIKQCADIGESAYTSYGESSFLWNRGKMKRLRDYFQICGHNSHWGLKVFSDKEGDYGMCIDTSRDNTITGIHWPSMQIFQQECVEGEGR